MCPDLELLTGFLIHVRRPQHRPLILDGRQRYRASDPGSGPFGGVDDLLCRLIEHAMIVGLQLDANFFTQHISYSTTSVTVPAPTVRPPSRIAKRRPFS